MNFADLAKAVPFLSPQSPDRIERTPTSESKVRSYTLDSLNISSIESSKGPHQRVENNRQRGLPEQNVEAASWTFTEILQSLSVREKDDVYLVITKCNQLVQLLQDTPSLKHDMAIDMVVNRIQFMLYHPAPQLRCAAYRVLRYSIASLDSILFMVQLKILLSIILSLSVPCPIIEKQEALKFIREFLNVPEGASFISVGVIKALVALIEHEGEESGNPNAASTSLANDEFNIPSSFTKLCIETICEIAVLKPHLVFYGGGFRLMISQIISGPSDIAALCLVVFMSILDKPEARLFLRNGLDLTSLTSVYSMVDDDDSAKQSGSRKSHNRALKVTFLISTFLKCWTGIICFSHNNFEAIRNILYKLKGYNNRIRSIIMDLILDILRIKAIPWLEDSAIYDLITSFHVFMSPGNLLMEGVLKEYLDLPPNSFEKSVISHYQGLLLKVLHSCDVVPLIYDIIDENPEEELLSKATFLLANILTLSVEVLPKRFVQEHITSAHKTSLSLTSIYKIDSAAKSQIKTNLGEKRRGEVKTHVKNMIIESRVNMNDTALKSLISRTKLLTLKDYEDWDWVQLSHLCQGPLRDRKRFCDIQEKYPKVLKYLMSFFRPFKYRFSRAPLRADNSHKLKHPKRVILVGCQLLEALLFHEAGYDYLFSNKLLPQMAEIFAQVGPKSGRSSDEPILSTRSLENTLSIGYVKFIGILSSSNKGLTLLNEWRFLQLISDIVDGNVTYNTNTHLLFNLLNNIDFVLEGPFRILLSKVLSMSREETKLFTLENVVPKLMKSEECIEFVIRSLANLLYDESKVVVGIAVVLLHNYFVVKGNNSRINVLIDMRPSTTVLSRFSHGKELLMTFCTTTKGFRLLHENGLIEGYLASTIRSLQTLDYLNTIEATLKKGFYPFSTVPQGSPKLQSIDCHHFFHYLLSTEDGFIFFNSQRAVLDEIIGKTFAIVQKLQLVDIKRHENKASQFLHPSITTNGPELTTSRTNSFESDISADESFKFDSPIKSQSKSDHAIGHPNDAIRENSIILTKTSDDDDEYMLMRLKQYLWIIGEIASSQYGIQILDPLYNPNMKSDHVIDLILQLFGEAKDWQIRGIAFHQLGKMASTNEGIEMLDDMNWESIESHNVQSPLTLAYPKSMGCEDLFNLEVLNPYQDATYISLFGNHGDELWANQQLDLDADDELGLQTNQKLDDKALSLINHLGSVLSRIERKAIKQLNLIKQNDREIFESPNLFLKTIRLVDKGNFKYKTRNFIFGLFDTVKIMENLIKRSRRLPGGRR